MLEKLKKWGLYIVGGLIFLLSLFGALARRGDKPQPDAGKEISREEIEQQNANAVEIESKQKDVVATVSKPVDTTPSKDIDEAIDRFNKS